MKALTSNKRNAARYFVLLAGVVAICCGLSTAQTISNRPLPPPPPPAATDMSADRGSPTDQRGPLTTFEEEIRAKRLIKLAEKEHKENVDRAQEISQLGQDLKTVLKHRSALEREDAKKLDRLEKLTRKVRGEAGGGESEVEIINVPSDIPSAAEQIADVADQLSKDVQKTPRQVVSAAVIDRANVLLKLVKILRGFARRF